MSLHFLPYIILTTAILVLLTALSIKRNHGVAYMICGLGLLGTLLSLFIQLGNGGLKNQLFLFEPLTPLLSLTMLIVVSIVWVQLYNYMEVLDERKEEFYLLLLLAALGALVLIASNHFASFFLGLELMSLTFVGMVAYSGKALKAQEAGVKYLLLSGISSALILMGIALLYLQFGSLSFDVLANGNQKATMAPWLTVTAITFMLGGMFFKLSLVPCHLWVADVLEGAPLPTSAILATLSKLASFVILWRIFTAGNWHGFDVVVDIVTAVAIASMLVGNFLGLLQNNLLRLMAYSSIAHFGYLLMVILMARSPESFFLADTFPVEAMVFYLVAYLFTLVGVFSVLMQIPGIRTVQDLTGLFWHNPAVALTITMLMLSLAGIPLTIGFMGKFYLVVSAVSHQMWWLLGALVVGSVIGLFYYLRVVMVMIKSDSGNQAFDGMKIPIDGLLLNYLIIFLVLGFGIFPGAFAQLLQNLSSH